MNPLKWYKDKVETMGMTAVDKGVFLTCLVAGALLCLASVGLFLWALPQVHSSDLKNQVVILIAFLLFTAALCGYTTCLVWKKEVMK